jgi:hypothetical protein
MREAHGKRRRQIHQIDLLGLMSTATAGGADDATLMLIEARSSDPA